MGTRKNSIKSTLKISYWRRPNKEGFAVWVKSKQNSEKQIAYHTGVNILKGQWDKKKNKPKDLPAKLQELERDLKATYAQMYSEGHAPTLKDVWEARNDPKKPQGQRITDWCDDYLTGEYSEGQKKAVATIKSNIIEFAPSLTFDRLRTPQIKEFFQWLTKKKVANNSQHKRLLALRHVATHAGVDAPELKAYKLPYSTVNAMTPRLTWPEVRQVIKTETKSDIEKAAKEVFLLCCFSGLRIEDILNPIDNKIHPSYYSAIMRKTKKEVYVTRHKYNENLFALVGKVKYSRQRLSSALDGLLDRAGLTDEVTIIRNIGPRQEVVKVPKFKAIAFHSGRRFYSRLLNDLGLGQEIARDELGHTFKSVTELYAGSPEHALRISRVRSAMEGLEKKMQELSALMKVA